MPQRLFGLILLLTLLWAKGLAVEPLTDDSDPKLISASLLHPKVTDASGRQKIVLKYHVTDNDGLHSMIIRVRGVGGVKATYTQEVIFKGAKDEYNEVELNLPPKLSDGEYEVSASISDRAGNVTPFLQAGEPLLVSVQVADSDPPTLDSISTSVQSVDVTNGAQTITFDYEISDPGSGLKYFWVMANPKSSWSPQYTSAQINFQGEQTASGQISVTIPGTAPTGPYRLVYRVGDQVGLHTQAVASSIAFDVVGAVSDSTPPTLDSISTSVQSVDVTSGAQTITLDYEISDADSGLKYFWVMANPKSSWTPQYTSTQINFQGEKTASGQISVTIPGTAPTGPYRLVYRVGDQAGLHTQAVASSVGFDVVGAVSDSTPPTLDSISTSVQSVDITNGAQTVTLDYEISDADSGLKYFWVMANPKSSWTPQYTSAQINFQGEKTASGQISVTIPGTAPTGPYRLVYRVGDQVGLHTQAVASSVAFDVVQGQIDIDKDGFPSDVDCDDNDKNINPGVADDTLNGVDNDCDGAVDEDYVWPLQNCRDQRHDLEVTQTLPDISSSIQTICVCSANATGCPATSRKGCFDNTPEQNGKLPMLLNIGNGDQICVYSLGSMSHPDTGAPKAYWAHRITDPDIDGDGYAVDVDCDDNNPDIHPDAPDNTFDGIDNDCDGEVDEDANSPPTAVDDAISVEEDSITTIDVLLNDADQDGDDINIANATAGNGDVEIQAGKELVYTPTENFFGSDVIIYTICDEGGLCDEGKVNVTVQPVNDPPVAGDVSISINEDTSTTVDLDGFISDVEGDIVSIEVGLPTSGSVSGDGRPLSYTPNLNFNGVDSIPYTIDDGNGGSDSGVVTVTVLPVNDPPTANSNLTLTTEYETVITFDAVTETSAADIDGDQLSVLSVTQPMTGQTSYSGTSVSYQPSSGHEGLDMFFVTLTDGAGGEVKIPVRIITEANPDPDGDGFLEDVDCDNNNADIKPGAPDNTLDGIDNDCDGFIDEDYVAPKFSITKTVESCQTFGGPGASCVYKIRIENSGGPYAGDLQIEDVTNQKVNKFSIFDSNNKPLKCEVIESVNPVSLAFSSDTVVSDRFDICTVPDIAIDNSNWIELTALLKLGGPLPNTGQSEPLNCAVVVDWDNRPNSILTGEFPSSCIDAIVYPAIDSDGDGFLNDVDCNDSDPKIYPGAADDMIDEIDNDCDGEIDEHVIACPDVTDKGMSWGKITTHADSGAVRVGCNGNCDARNGDSLCRDPLPLLCIKPGELPRPATLPQSSSRFHQWSGGEISTTAPIAACAFDHINDVNARCAAEFGQGWRLANYHDGVGHSFWAYGEAPDAPARFWVHIRDQVNGICWKR